ncbi:MAG: hypothetical protein ABI624_20665 [Casimicrobiaceae bacterium]
MSTQLLHGVRHAESNPQAGPTIADWLLDGPAQLRAGPHAGAVAGCVSASASASYVYPEITGYYLQWLAWRARRFGDAQILAERAAAVQRWLAVWLAADDPPATRVHLDGTTGDWRNRAVFCFDIAMVLRGLGAAAQARLLSPDAAVVAGVSRQLERLIAADGRFDACAMSTTGDTFPARWSTRRGAFLAKAAAGILTASRALPGIPIHVVRAAEHTFAASIDALGEAPHRDAHPLLYAFEGVMALPQHHRFHATLPMVAAEFDSLLANASTGGFVPETIGTAAAQAPERMDVLAQTLRIGHLLAAHRPQQPPDRVALARLRQALTKSVQPSGAVQFDRRAAAAHWNVWAAMFADQALAFAAPVRDTDAWWRTDPLLV